MRSLVLPISVAVATLARPALAAPPAPRPNVVRVEHRPTDQNPSLGPEDAPVTAELFFTPGHPESNKAYRKLVELQSRHPRRMRVVFRVIVRQAQVVVPIAAVEAYAQGKFEAFMDAILARREGTVRREHLPAVAKAAGLDPVRLERALERATDPQQPPEPLESNERRWKRRAGTNRPVPELLFNGLPISEQFTSLDVDDLERHYARAWSDAQELLADGVPRRRLVEANERRHLATDTLGTYTPGSIDDPEPGWQPPEGPPPLLARVLDLDGLPSSGPLDAPVELVIACNLRYSSCSQQRAMVDQVQKLYPTEVRAIWYPWYDTSVEGNEDAPRLHAAALCAEQQGEGWRWIEETMRQTTRGRAEADLPRLIEAVAGITGVDRAALDACLEGGSGGVDGAAVDARVRAAVGAGIDHSPALVVGGRVYIGSIHGDWHGLAGLIDAELAPGLLERMVPSWDTGGGGASR